MTRIHEAIQNANLTDICNPREGDCESVAVALHKTFTAESFLCIFDPMIQDAPVHATARINGDIYDGQGKTSEDALADYISYLKLSDFPDSVTTVEEMTERINEDGYQEFPIKTGLETLSYDRTLVSEIVSEIEKHY